jgi:hypothetical protein
VTGGAEIDRGDVESLGRLWPHDGGNLPQRQWPDRCGIADQLGHERVSVTQDTYLGRAAASPKVAEQLRMIDETAS